MGEPQALFACRYPGGPGCENATPDGPCCGQLVPESARLQAERFIATALDDQEALGYKRPSPVVIERATQSAEEAFGWLRSITREA